MKILRPQHIAGIAGRVALAALLALALTACTSAPAPSATPAPTTPAPTTPAPTAPVPTTPVPTAAPQALLPAPLYMFKPQADSQQLVRLEADGLTSRQITHEQGGLQDFAVSPVDSSLLYIAGTGEQQRLIHADALGEHAAELLHRNIVSPAWAPDGQRYAFEWRGGPAGDGVYVGQIGGGTPALLLANIPQPGDRAQAGQQFAPLSWAPDGQRLLLLIVPDNGPDAPSGDIGSAGLAAVDASGQIAHLAGFGGAPYTCISASWSADSAHIYCANYGATAGAPALWRVAASGGTPELLVGSPADGEQVDVFNAREFGGQLYAFSGKFPVTGGTQSYALQRFDLQGAHASALNGDTYDITAALGSAWAPDGSGVLIQRAQDGQLGNTLVWVPAQGGASQPLPVQASGTPQWGASGS